MAELVVDGVSRRLGRGSFAIREVSLSVPSGSCLALIGRSGSGKTTLLRIVAGLEGVDRGRVFLAGRDVTSDPPHRRNIGMVFQGDALYPHLSVYKNIAFGLTRRGRRTTEVDAAVRAAAALTAADFDSADLERAEFEAAEFEAADRAAEVGGGIDAWLVRMPHALSGGERQRVALARAIVRRPAVLLLDEPLAHLDAPERRRMRGVLARWRRRVGATIVLVTHDVDDAAALGDEVAVMTAGAIVQRGPLDELRRRPADLAVADLIGKS